MKHKAFLLLLASLLLVVATAGCRVTQTQEGEMPEVDVDVEKGQLPKYDVDGPDVDVEMEEKTIKVPDIDVDLPGDPDYEDDDKGDG